MRRLRWDLLLTAALVGAWLMGEVAWAIPVVVAACWMLAMIWKGVFGGADDLI